MSRGPLARDLPKLEELDLTVVAETGDFHDSIGRFDSRSSGNVSNSFYENLRSILTSHIKFATPHGKSNGGRASSTVSSPGEW